ncbi:MAG TPA: endonuclease/exonuclease/phosphatase family protein [Gemmatimonadales bacterium]|nr:endonuclease/exonuclease/phosphatase family protein [Gemmatimonadales bacterium]
MTPPACVAVLALAVLPAQGEAAAREAIRIASFNIQAFGTAKAQDERVMAVLARIARRFDVMAVQELRDESGEVPGLFLAEINRRARDPYAMIVGPRLGRSASKEQYVIYYRTDLVEFVDSFTVRDTGDRFERPPLVARFVAGEFDFRLIVVHIRPDDAAAELAALARLAAVVEEPEEGDVIILGDLNADCDYFNSAGQDHPLQRPRFHWAIPTGTRTAVRTECAYDRILLMEGTAGHEFVPNSARVFRYDREFRITSRALIRAVSDHYPVFAEYRITGPDDDGPRRR